MRALLLTLFIALPLAATGCKKAPEAPAKLGVDAVVVRIPGIEGRPGAAYFTLHGGEQPDRLVAVSSPKAATIELHESSMENGIMSMRALTGADVPEKGRVVFRPGGNHAMVYGIDPAVKPGGTMAMRFTFQSGAAIDVTAAAIGPADEMPAEHDDH